MAGGEEVAGGGEVVAGGGKEVVGVLRCRWHPFVGS